MIGRIAAAAVLACLVAACVMAPAPALAGEKEEYEQQHVITIKTESDGKGWLGIGIMELDEKFREKLDAGDDIKGIVVTEVYDDSPAEDAGFEEGDIVISIDGEKGGDLKSFVKLIQSRDPGDKVEIDIYRDGKMKSLKATLAEKEDTFIWSGIDLEGLEGLEALEGLKALEHIYIPEIAIGLSSGGRGKLGVYIEDLSEDMAEYFEVPDGKGVLVEGTVEGGAAEKAGIKAGDVIYKIDGERIWDSKGLVKAISSIAGEGDKPIVLIRKGNEINVVAAVPESEYDEAMKEYKILVDELGDQKAFLKSYEHMSDDEKEELKKELEEVRKELEELKKELKKELKGISTD